MKICNITRQKFDDDGKTKKGNIEYLTIDEGWSEIPQYADIFKQCHARYKAENFQLKSKDIPIKFSVNVLYNA